MRITKNIGRTGRSKYHPQITLQFSIRSSSFIHLLDFLSAHSVPGNALGTGAREWTRHWSCLQGPSRSTTAGHPGLGPNPTGAGDWSPLPLPTWPYYYLTLMKLTVAFISLDATGGGKACEDNHLESHQRLLSGLYWTGHSQLRYATFERCHWLIFTAAWQESRFP